jgi:hypothetical protein
MTARRTVTLHVVHRLGWDWTDEYYARPDPEELEELGIESYLDDTPVRAFLGRAAAEAAARALDAKELGEDNPFEYGGDGWRLSDFSSLTPVQFADRLTGAGLTPPAMNRVGRLQREALTQWWDRNAFKMTRAQKDTVVAALDRARLFEVRTVEAPLVGAPRKGPTPLYAIEKVLWQQGGQLVSVPEGQAPPPGARPNPFKPGSFHVQLFTPDPAGGAEVLKVFADCERAEEECRKLESKARAGANPFRYGGMKDWTSFDTGRLHDWVVDLGLSPPRPARRGTALADTWWPWWDANVATMSEWQRARMWEALDRVRFHRVVELRPDEEDADGHPQ